MTSTPTQPVAFWGGMMIAAAAAIACVLTLVLGDASVPPEASLGLLLMVLALAASTMVGIASGRIRRPGSSREARRAFFGGRPPVLRAVLVIALVGIVMTWFSGFFLTNASGLQARWFVFLASIAILVSNLSFPGSEPEE